MPSQTSYFMEELLRQPDAATALSYLGVPAQGTIPVASSDPGSPVAGQLYLNSSTGKVKCFDGSNWILLN